MTDSDKKLEEQLDAMLKETGMAEDAARAETQPQESADAATNTTDDDLMGAEFADQVQKMLDEAKGELNDSSAQQSPASKPAGSEQELIGQIDKMLAEQADEALEGDFESVDELLAEDADADQPAEQLKAKLESESESERKQVEQITPKAAAVGAEMDADDAQMQSIEEMFPDEDDVSSVLDGSSVIDGSRAISQQITEGATGRSATDAPSPAAQQAVHPRGPSALKRALIAMNRPLAALPATWRNAVGMWGVANMLGFAVVASFLLGGLAGAAGAFVLTSVVAVVMVRKLFLC